MSEPVPPHRDLAAFSARASGYEEGWLGRLHHEIVERTVALALSEQPEPRRVLDVGCGTGYLLRTLADRCPDAERLAGVDASAAMIEVAGRQSGDDRIALAVAPAERLPFGSGEFDLVVSTTSFDHWSDQATGLGECARVLERGGCLVLVDQFSLLLLPTLAVGRRGKARTRRRAGRLVAQAGFRNRTWHRVYPLIQAVTASK